MQSPFSALYKHEPDYRFLKVFGCACYPHIRPYNTHKLDFHSKECIFLGYFDSHKGYKCLAPDGMIYISKDVLFNEYKFPYVSLFSNTISEAAPTPHQFLLYPILFLLNSVHSSLLLLLLVHLTLTSSGSSSCKNSAATAEPAHTTTASFSKSIEIGGTSMHNNSGLHSSTSSEATSPQSSPINEYEHSQPSLQNHENSWERWHS